MWWGRSLWRDASTRKVSLFTPHDLRNAFVLTRCVGCIESNLILSYWHTQNVIKKKLYSYTVYIFVFVQTEYLITGIKTELNITCEIITLSTPKGVRYKQKMRSDGSDKTVWCAVPDTLLVNAALAWQDKTPILIQLLNKFEPSCNKLENIFIYFRL